VRRVEDIAEAWWAPGFRRQRVLDINKKIYGTIEAWRNRPIEGEHPSVYLGSIMLRRSWAAKFAMCRSWWRSGSTARVIGRFSASARGRRRIGGWSAFLKHLKERGLKDVRLVVSDACIGLAGSAAEFFPAVIWQMYVVHWYRDIFRSRSLD
jgi:putative transposase